MLTSIAQAKPHKVAVIDSGYNGKDAVICKSGNLDLITVKWVVGKDTMGHGTAVANTIGKGNKNYCLVIIRVFSKYSDGASIPGAIYAAIYDKVDVINLSIEGHVFDWEEFDALRAATKRGIKVFVASGNDNQMLNMICNIYPACYGIPGVTVVGSFDEENNVDNTGLIVKEKEKWCSEGACGTSLSTAIATQKYLRTLK